MRSGPGSARTILLFQIISTRPSKQSRIVRTFLKVYMELGSYFLFLQEQVKDIIIRSLTPITTICHCTISEACIICNVFLISALILCIFDLKTYLRCVLSSKLSNNCRLHENFVEGVLYFDHITAPKSDHVILLL